MKKMWVSVVIPVYNEERQIGGCLESLSKQSLGNFEVVVVDDGSTDRTLEVLREFGKVRVLKQEHLGAGAARNLGASRAKGEVLVFVDADMTFERGFLEKLTAPIGQDGVKGTWSGEEYVSNWENVWARAWNYNEGIADRRRHVAKKIPPIFRAILKSEFERVGGFDPGGYTDDYSLSRKLGYGPCVARGAKFYHDNPRSLKEVFSQAKWVGKREYKLGWLGVGWALLRVSLPVAKIVGLYKAVKYRAPAFFVFKIVYNTGVALGILEYYLRGKGAR